MSTPTNIQELESQIESKIDRLMADAQHCRSVQCDICAEDEDRGRGYRDGLLRAIEVLEDYDDYPKRLSHCLNSIGVCSGCGKSERMT